jgi:hypothetical protein
LVTITTVRIALGGDSFYLHCLVYRNMVGLRVGFGAPVLLLLTVPRRRPTVFLRCMSYVVSYCFDDTFACVPCCFLVYGRYLPLAPSFNYLILPPPFPGFPVPFPCALWLYGRPIIQLFIFLWTPYQFQNISYYSIYCFLWIPYQLQIIILVIGLSCALSCFLFGVRLGSLLPVIVAGSYGGCVHWKPLFLVDLIIFYLLLRTYVYQMLRYSYLSSNYFVSKCDSFSFGNYSKKQYDFIWHNMLSINNVMNCTSEKGRELQRSGPKERSFTFHSWSWAGFKWNIERLYIIMTYFLPCCIKMCKCWILKYPSIITVYNCSLIFENI